MQTGRILCALFCFVGVPMPTISAFYGILIQMFWVDHAPPHFHALYAEYEVTVNIQTLQVIEGEMPKRALKLVRQWALVHRNELLENWQSCEKRRPLKTIPPLV